MFNLFKKTTTKKFLEELQFKYLGLKENHEELLKEHEESLEKLERIGSKLRVEIDYSIDLKERLDAVGKMNRNVSEFIQGAYRDDLSERFPELKR